MKAILRMHQHDFCGGEKYQHTREIANYHIQFIFICMIFLGGTDNFFLGGGGT